MKDDEIYYLKLYLKDFFYDKVKYTKKNDYIFEKKENNNYEYVIISNNEFFCTNEKYSFESYEAFKRKQKIIDLNL